MNRSNPSADAAATPRPATHGAVVGIVVAHGQMAQGLADAVKKISGLDEEALVPVSNDGCSPDTLFEMLAEAVGDGPAIIFTDLQSGSCALAARITCRQPNRTVISGVNLPMLLDFVFNRNLPLDDLVARVVQKGRESVQNIPRSVSHVDPPVSR